MFDIKKFFAGFNIFNGEKAGKIIFYIIIISACLVVYNLLTRPQQVQKITVQKGGSAVIQQQQEKKRVWWIPTPFAELYVYKENDRQGTGGRFGGRFEW